MKKSALPAVLFTAAASLVAMALVETLWQPGYWLKSACKILLFGGIPALFFFRRRTPFGNCLKWPAKRNLWMPILLGIGTFFFCVGGYFLLRPWLSWEDISSALGQQAGVTQENFLWVGCTCPLSSPF